MIKRTLYFENPSYLSIKMDQLVVSRPGIDDTVAIPVEDIGIVFLDNQQITLTHEVIRRLQDNKVALISCDKQHMPHSLMLPLEGNYTQTEIQRYQINASVPLKKQLWQQTITAKIKNQKLLLRKIGKSWRKLKVLEGRVLSGDPKNVEAQAASYYWSELFDDFTRDRYGSEPNIHLNYGYAVLRAIVSRALTSSGLLPTLGIFHKNKYNAFGLADDIMEPFRPFVDFLVYEMIKKKEVEFTLTKDNKKKLLSLPVMDGQFGKVTRPIMIGASMTSKSLADCFQGKRRRIIYPQLI